MSDATKFRFVIDWQALDAAEGEAIAAFWRSEGAITDAAQIAARLPQVVLHARAADERVAAVCTAVPVTPPAFGQPMHYYRCFVGREWRATRLVLSMMRRAQTTLEAYAREHDFPCIGVLLELENERFRETMRRPIWKSTGFVYVGKSARGLDLRAYYFDGARLR